jgi:hypothetical protein
MLFADYPLLKSTRGFGRESQERRILAFSIQLSVKGSEKTGNGALSLMGQTLFKGLCRFAELPTLAKRGSGFKQ